jgi:hypothetical protein
MEYVVEQFMKDPNYQPPEEFLKLWVTVRPILDEAKAIREQRKNRPPDLSDLPPLAP